MSDRLDVLVGKESCPVCGTISQKNTARCPECGTFHSGIHLEEREAPTPEERVANREVDPSDYSMNPEIAISSEDFEGDDANIKNWGGDLPISVLLMMMKLIQPKKSKSLNLKKSSRIDFLIKINQ